LAPAAQAIYIDFNAKGPVFGCTQLPGLPSLNGADGTYALNSTFANEFFFQCDSAEMPWEAALDSQGTGFVEASTSRLKYRKLFCWGSHPGGRHWQEFLAQPGEAYLEIQAGLAPTQMHGLPMPANASWDWTQVFGYLEADAARVHGKDWDAACQAVDVAFQARLPQADLYRLEAVYRSRADLASGELPAQGILQSGSGWGALELRCRAQTPGTAPIPAAFAFPESTLGSEQAKWLALLEDGVLPDQEPTALPGEWMIQPDWEQRLATSHDRNWYALLHLGVMRLEQFDEAGAAAAWQESLRQKPSAWAYRNLAVLSLRCKEDTQARQYYAKAWELAAQSGSPPAALAVEYLQMLAETHQWERGMEVYHSLPPQIQEADRVQILLGQFAMALNDLMTVERVLQREYAVVREGENTLTDLWFELQARRESARSGRPLDETLGKEVQAIYPPPARIDFRSFIEQG
jgi:tetratricopeptide (TPR) repeat protein